MPLQPLWIRGKVVEDVEDYRYLGVVNRLDWKKKTLFLEEDPSTCAARCWRSFTSLLLPAPFSLLLCVGAVASEPVT